MARKTRRRYQRKLAAWARRVREQQYADLEQELHQQQRNRAEQVPSAEAVSEAGTAAADSGAAGADSAKVSRRRRRHDAAHHDRPTGDDRGTT